MHNLPINQQINNYLRQQQALLKHQARQTAGIKKADPIHQDRKSACIPNQITQKVNQVNQFTQGANQYEPV